MNRYNPDAEAAVEEATIALLAELGWEEHGGSFAAFVLKTSTSG